MAAAFVHAGTIRWVVQDVPPHFSFNQGQAPRSVAELGRLGRLYFSHVFPPLVPREIHVIVPRDAVAQLSEGRAQDGRLLLADLLKRLSACMDERARGGPCIA